MDDCSKVTDIIHKLKHLDCPLFGSGDDAWIKETLFTPNLDRFHLIEWIFSKLKFVIPKGDESQNSSEAKVKNLLAAVSALGLCHKENSDIIEGIAPMKVQLEFWALLVNILWKKWNSSTNSTLGSISEQYERQCKYVSNLCNSVSFADMFKEKVQLFPPHLIKESEEASKSAGHSKIGLDYIKMNGSSAHQNTIPNWSVKNSILEENFCSADSDLSCNEAICKLEDEMCNAQNNFRNYASIEFKETYDKLKLNLDIPPDNSIDVGSHFKSAQLKSETFQQVKDSLSVIESSEKELKNFNSELEYLRIPCEPLSDSLLGEYITILKEEKESK